MKTNILIGTLNPVKTKQFIHMLAASPDNVNYVTGLELKLKEVEETGTTLHQNAYLKASQYQQQSGYWCISDDTGFFIDALDGKPGVEAAYWGGDHDEEAHWRKTLKVLKGQTNRRASLKTVLCFVTDKLAINFESELPGNVSHEPSVTSNGNGYQRIFIPEGFDTIMADLDYEERIKITPRYQSVQKFISWLKQQPELV